MINEEKLERQLQAEFSEDMLDLKSKLKKVTAESEGVKKTKVLRLILPILAIAASLTLAVMFLPQLFQSTTSEGLYSAYYEPYPMALNQRGGGEIQLNQAIVDYTGGRYAEASVKFNEIFEATNDAVYLLYHGSSEQALGNYIAAISIYDRVIKLNDERVSEQAGWYKVLALIALNKKEEADEILESFGQSHYKYKEAQEILQQDIGQ
jgi:tetratricopeptide (TPR) repeat protein